MAGRVFRQRFFAGRRTLSGGRDCPSSLCRQEKGARHAESSAGNRSPGSGGRGERRRCAEAGGDAAEARRSDRRFAGRSRALPKIPGNSPILPVVFRAPRKECAQRMSPGALRSRGIRRGMSRRRRTQCFFASGSASLGTGSVSSASGISRTQARSLPWRLRPHRRRAAFPASGSARWHRTRRSRLWSSLPGTGTATRRGKAAAFSPVPGRRKALR